MAASVVLPGAYPRHIANPSAAWAAPPSGISGAYSAAVGQNAEDYDKIMGNYNTVFNQAQAQSTKPPVSVNPLEYNAIQPYQQTARLNQVADQFADMSRTGGYSEQDVNSLRERSISPIRSIFSTALNNLRRQKVLQGGYSPNYGAVQSKLMRDSASQIGERTTAVNAELAKMIAEGKRFGLSGLSPIAQRESELTHDVNVRNAEGRNQFGLANTNMAMELAKLNSGLSSNALNNSLAATQGMASLYGTTPALTNTFGSQLLNSNQQNLAGQQAAANINQNRANTGLQLVSQAQSAPPQYTSTSSHTKLTPQNAYSTGFLLTPPPTTTSQPPTYNRNVMLGQGSRGSLFNY